MQWLHGLVATFRRMRRLIAAAFALSLVLLPATASAAPAERRGHGQCQAIKVEGSPTGEIRSITVISAATALPNARRYGADTALWTSYRGGIDCAQVRTLIATVLLAPDEQAAWALQGWRVRRTNGFRTDGVAVHQVWATRGGDRITYVRRGGRPRVAARVYRAGQRLGFPGGDNLCTSSFALRQKTDGMLLGLSAGHCSDYPRVSNGVFETENVDRAKGDSKLFTLGTAIANSYAGGDGPDAMQFTIHGAGLAAQEIQRDGGAPLRVVGVAPWSRLRKGRTVCYVGVVTGGPHCGRIHGQSSFPQRSPVTCARGITSRKGDSGGPVFTRPNERGEVRAVGVLSRSSVGALGRDMCFTPIQIVLETFAAELPTGAFAVPPPPGSTPGS
jgi:hypothetical protein